MIEIARDGGRLVARGSLPGRCFVDSDWVAEGPLRAVLVEDGSVAAVDGARFALAGDPRELAAAVLVATAEAALEAAAAAPTGARAVTGNGAVARLVGSKEGGGRVSAIVDTTGGPAAIAGATRELADLGVLVLTVPPAGAVPLDLYPDVHVRGLHLVGVGATEERVRAVLGEGRHRAALELPCPQVRSGEALPPDAAWFELLAG